MKTILFKPALAHCEALLTADRFGGRPPVVYVTVGLPHGGYVIDPRWADLGRDVRWNAFGLPTDADWIALVLAFEGERFSRGVSALRDFLAVTPDHSVGWRAVPHESGTVWTRIPVSLLNGVNAWELSGRNKSYGLARVYPSRECVDYMLPGPSVAAFCSLPADDGGLIDEWALATAAESREFGTAVVLP